MTYLTHLLLEGIANYSYNSLNNIKPNAGSLPVTPEVERLFTSVSGTARLAQTNTGATLNNGNMLHIPLAFVMIVHVNRAVH